MRLVSDCLIWFEYVQPTEGINCDCLFAGLQSDRVTEGADGSPEGHGGHAALYA